MSAVTVNSEALNAVVAKAIFDSFTDEQRQTLLQDAIANLLVPKKESWQREAKAPLAALFEGAVHAAARQIVQETIEQDPAVSQAIRDLLTPLIDSLVQGNYDGLPEAIGAAFGEWLRDRGVR